MDDLATGADGLIRASDVARVGGDDRALRHAAARGALVRVAPGVYLDAERWHATEAIEQHVLRARARLPRLRPGAAFSHVTASALHGWERLDGWPESVEIADALATRTRRQASAVMRPFTLPQLPPVSIDGMPTTGAAATAIDLCLTAPFRQAVVAIDSAAHEAWLIASGREEHLRPGRVPLGADEFDTAAALLPPDHRGRRRLERVRSFVDGGAGSAGESLSRIVMRELGAPSPVLQQPFFDARGRIGEVDFWWPAFGVVGEFDGVKKYSRAEFRRGRSPEQVVVDEKVREDRLRAHPAVRGFARWLWADVMTPARLEAALVRAGVRW